MLKTIAFFVVLCAALFSALASAQSDQDSPTLVSLSIYPVLVDTSVGFQVITVTAHITDNLSGCSDNCLSVYLAPRFGPELQTKLASFHTSSLITGTLTDGIYQTQILLPKYSYEGTWAISSFYAMDSVGNACGWPYPPVQCNFDMPAGSFINRKAEALNFFPRVGSSPYATPTPTFTRPAPTPTPIWDPFATPTPTRNP